jgi:hypothetical protein
MCTHRNPIAQIQLASTIILGSLRIAFSDITYGFTRVFQCPEPGERIVSRNWCNGATARKLRQSRDGAPRPSDFIVRIEKVEGAQPCIEKKAV